MDTLVLIKKLRPEAKTPQRGSEYAAGADLCACLDTEVAVAPGETVFVPTGIAAAIPAGLAGFVYARSGLSCKKGLAPANKVGVIDSDYRGEILVALYNHSREPVTVAPGDRIAQMVIAPVLPAVFMETDELPGTARGTGGFGSTGK